MLDFLVTSAARRRLLTVLWVEDRKGSASDLARRAHVSFATGYRELRAMARHRLVTVHVENDVTSYAANREHPVADALQRIVTWRGEVPSVDDDRVRSQLAELGAPLRSEAESNVATADLEEVVVRGVELARRDPATARALPVLLHNRRRDVDLTRLTLLARQHGVGHALGFLLAVAGKLGGDRQLASLARTMRDHRVHDQPFFSGASRRSSTSFRLAARWGFRMSTDEAAFASTFRRFAGADT